MKLNWQRESMRTHEMGTRIALGARGGDILKLIFANAMLTTLAGVVLGLGASLALTQLLGGLLYQVTATDPNPFLWIPLLLASVSFLACYIPARRAARLDPMAALAHS
jgi:putative ABC transport system permease protein